MSLTVKTQTIAVALINVLLLWMLVTKQTMASSWLQGMVIVATLLVAANSFRQGHKVLSSLFVTAALMIILNFFL